jgi:hypothetical protein
LLQILNEFLLVASATRGLGVFSAEGITGKPVIKSLLPVLPKDQGKVSSVMFRVTILAVAILGLCMQPASAVDARLHFTVAGQALGLHLV